MKHIEGIGLSKAYERKSPPFGEDFGDASK